MSRFRVTACMKSPIIFGGGYVRELGTPLIVSDPVLQQIGGGQAPAPDALPVALSEHGEHELRGRSGAVRIWTGEAGS